MQPLHNLAPLLHQRQLMADAEAYRNALAARRRARADRLRRRADDLDRRSRQLGRRTFS